MGTPFGSRYVVTLSVKPSDFAPSGRWTEPLRGRGKNGAVADRDKTCGESHADSGIISPHI